MCSLKKKLFASQHFLPARKIKIKKLLRISQNFSEYRVETFYVCIFSNFMQRYKKAIIENLKYLYEKFSRISILDFEHYY